jgi:rare lipoprotein A
MTTIVRSNSTIPTIPLALPARIAAALTALCIACCCGQTAIARAGAPATAGGTSSGTANAKPKTHPTGIATWFGPGMYGQQTACGQTLTPAVVGVANRTLPCGTLVQVTYRGHTLVLPVLDRGPYANHADWDLTASAAEKLEITETVRISTRVIGSAPNTPLLGAPPVTPAEAATGGAQADGAGAAT